MQSGTKVEHEVDGHVTQAPSSPGLENFDFQTPRADSDLGALAEPRRNSGTVDGIFLLNRKQQGVPPPCKQQQ